MACKRKPCKPKKSNRIEKPGKNKKWLDYPSPDENGFGHGKFCYFISCPDSKLPIRDYTVRKENRKEKLEPHYEEKSYNECAFCNQRGIRHLKKRRGNYIIFVTKYHGTIAKYQGNFYITGWFPISQYREILEIKRNDEEKIIYHSRIAYKSDNPIFLSIKDSIELSDKKWKIWFGTNLPKNMRLNPPKPQLNYFTKFLEKDSIALNEIKDCFEDKSNRITEYIREIRNYERER